LRPFKNGSGSISWRVSGVLHGERVRRNFRDRGDVLAEKQGLELRAIRVKPTMQTARKKCAIGMQCVARESPQNQASRVL
jgi:hypothetical protein